VSPQVEVCLRELRYGGEESGGDKLPLASDQCQALVARRLSPEIAQAQELALNFINIIRERHVDELSEWLIKASTSGLAEFRRFARGVTSDLSAVRAALSYQWSQGQVEGQVHRLKMIKRQMYGRAKLDLLRARVLYAS
jgi:transposase